MMHDKSGKFKFLLSITIVSIFIVFISLTSSCKKHPPEENYLEPVNISNNPGWSEFPSIAVDSKGTVHLVWNDYPKVGNLMKQEIFYAFKPMGGNWSTPVNISNNSMASRFPSIAVDKNDVIHLAWQDASPNSYWKIFYIYKTNDTWSVPETIAGEVYYVVPKIAIDNSNNIHLVWKYGGYDEGIRYAMRNPKTGWSNPTVIAPYPRNLFAGLTIVSDDSFNLHVTWDESDTDTSCSIFYSMKPLNGAWSIPEKISTTGFAATSSPLGVADKEGNVHFIWHDNLGSRYGDLAYRTRYANGLWSSIEACSSITRFPKMFALVCGPDDIVHLIWDDYFEPDTVGSLCYSKRIGSGWDKMSILTKSFRGYAIPTAAVDFQGNIHIAFWVEISSEEGGNYDIFYLEFKP